MTGPSTTLWPLEAHTLGKHRILRAYLDAWLPILGSWNGRLLFVDGFSGPGEYQNQEIGSPQIALKALLEHRSPSAREVVFMFIEVDKERHEHLRNLLAEKYPTLPGSIKIHTINGEFADAFGEVLSALDDAKKQMAPAFVMIDPFGVKGLPMSMIQRIFSHPTSEVYISFMYESMNRFMGRPEFKDHLDLLFGCPDWRKALEIQAGEERKRFLYDLYRQQLKAAGATQVVHFDLYEENRLIYALFFGTQNIKGSDVMKKAIWKIAPAGNFAFRGTRSQGQLSLNIDTPNFDLLRNQLVEHFGYDVAVSIEEVEEYVSSDQTDFHSSHVKRSVLVPLEKSNSLEVVSSDRKRKNAYPAGTVFRFKVPTHVS